MDVLSRVEAYLARLQFKRLFVFRFKQERALQHVNGLIAGMEVSVSNTAGRDIGEEHDYFFSIYPGDRLAQYFRPRNLRRALCANICCPTDPHRHTSKTDTEKQKRFVHGFLPLVAPLHPPLTYAQYA